MSKRVHFCGVIQGSVVQREWETEQEAVMRAETELLVLMERSAKRFSQEGDNTGPNIGLEINDNI